MTDTATCLDSLDSLDITTLTTLGSSPILYWEIESAGFGAMMSRIQVGFQIALAHGYRIHFKMNGCRYIYPFEVAMADLNAAGLAKTSFVFQDGAERGGVITNAKEKVQQWHFGPYYGSRWCYLYQNAVFPSGRLGITSPKPTRHQWAARIVKHITAKPNSALTELLADTKLMLGWAGPGPATGTKVGLHIRHGDKITESPILAVSVYLDYLRRVIKKHALVEPVIFLTSDNPAVYPELVALALQRGLITQASQVLYDTTEIRYNDNNNGRVTQQPQLAVTESLTAAKNILLLGDCDYVIGTHNAQFGLLGGLLCVANHNYDEERHYLINSCDSTKLHHWDTFLPAQGAGINTLPE